MSRPKLDLALACGLAALAGAVDTYGLARLGDLYVSFMSGNTTQLGLAIGEAKWGRAEGIAALVAGFVAGAALGAALGVLGGRRHAAVVTFAVAVALALPLVRPGWTVGCYVVAMGALNAAMSRVGEAAVSLTYVTGTLVKFGQGLGHALTGRGAGWAWLLQAPMWLSLLAGAAVAVLTRHWLGDAPWPLASACALLALATLAHKG